LGEVLRVTCFRPPAASPRLHPLPDHREPANLL